MTPGLQWCQELDDREEKEELRWVGKSPRKGRQEGDEVVRGRGWFRFEHIEFELHMRPQR